MKNFSLEHEGTVKKHTTCMMQSKMAYFISDILFLFLDENKRTDHILYFITEDGTSAIYSTHILQSFKATTSFIILVNHRKMTKLLAFTWK